MNLLRVGRAQSIIRRFGQFRSSALGFVPLALLLVIIMRLAFLSIIFVLFGLAAA